MEHCHLVCGYCIAITVELLNIWILRFNWTFSRKPKSNENKNEVEYLCSFQKWTIQTNAIIFYFLIWLTAQYLSLGTWIHFFVHFDICHKKIWNRSHNTFQINWFTNWGSAIHWLIIPSACGSTWLQPNKNGLLFVFQQFQFRFAMKIKSYRFHSNCFKISVIQNLTSVIYS